MNAIITGETDELIGVSVVDEENDVEHLIEVEKQENEGVRNYQTADDEYPWNSGDRTVYQNEMVAQACEYGKWYVYDQKGYDTLEPRRNPDRIAGTLLALRDMDDAQFRQWFGTLYQHLRSVTEGNEDHPIDIVPDAPGAKYVVYRQDVYLDADFETLYGLHETFNEETAELVLSAIGELSADGLLSEFASRVSGETKFDELADHVTDALSQTDEEFPSIDIDHVSDPYYVYDPGNDEPDETVGRQTDPQADTVIELFYYPAEEFEVFRGMLIHNLLCQIRDFYIGMGVEPPGLYSVLGSGMRESTLRYKTLDMYPEYFDTTADIDGYWWL